MFVDYLTKLTAQIHPIYMCVHLRLHISVHKLRQQEFIQITLLKSIDSCIHFIFLVFTACGYVVLQPDQIYGETSKIHNTFVCILLTISVIMRDIKVIATIY